MSNTRQKIVDKTAELLERQGYHGTGLNQIVQESDTPRGSLYYYFPDGKEELAAEAVRTKTQKMNAWMAARLAQDTDAVEAIVGFLRETAHAVRGHDCTNGAPIAAVALEASGSSERIRSACQHGYARWRDTFKEKLESDGFPSQRAASLAVVIEAALEGSIILSRTEKDTWPLLQAADEIEYLLTAARAELNP